MNLTLDHRTRPWHEANRSHSATGRLRCLPLLIAVFLSLVCRPTAAAVEFGEPVPGRRVYDQSGLLTTAETERLEESAAALTAAGAPTIVYLRIQPSDAAATIDDAAELMEDWVVASAPGAKDGIVLFVNVEP